MPAEGDSAMPSRRHNTISHGFPDYLLTKIARQEARRLFFEIRLWDSDAVIDKLQEVYSDLPVDVQAEIPLQRVWTLLPDRG
jgi:hypothetical protein